jgi:hypothetical protein
LSLTFKDTRCTAYINSGCAPTEKSFQVPTGGREREREREKKNNNNNNNNNNTTSCYNVLSNGAVNTTIIINKTKQILSYQHLFICAVLIATCFDLSL